MYFSHFAPFGHTRFGDDQPIGETIFNDKLANYGVESNFPADENLKGRLYADSMVAAGCRQITERARAEQHPLSTNDFLALQEFERGIPPRATATLRQRRQLLYTIRRLDINGRLSTIAEALKDYLGDDLVLYRTTCINELGYQEMTPPGNGNYVGWDVPIRMVRLRASVCQLNKVVTVPATWIFGSHTQFVSDQVLTADPGSRRRCERITVERATSKTLTALFRVPHNKGTIVTSARHPNQWSSKRVHHVVVSAGLATDPEILSGVALLMRRLVKGTATWQVIEESTPGHCGPFTLGTSKLGVEPIRDMTL